MRRMPDLDGTLNTVLPAGWTEQQRYNVMAGSWQQLGIQTPSAPPLDSTALQLPHARDRVLFGNVADEMRDFARANQLSWSIQSGKLVMERRTTGYAFADLIGGLDSAIATKPRARPGRPPVKRTEAQAALREAIEAGRLPNSKPELRAIPEKELGRILNAKPDTAGRAREEFLKYFKD
jgi:hypothetical protein